MVEKEWTEFKKYYQRATLSKFRAYRGGINFEYDGMAYDVFKNKIGGPTHHYDRLGDKLIVSLGRQIKDPPPFQS